MLAGTVVKRLPLGEKVAGSNPVASIEKKAPNCDRFELFEFFMFPIFKI